MGGAVGSEPLPYVCGPVRQFRPLSNATIEIQHAGSKAMLQPHHRSNHAAAARVSLERRNFIRLRCTRPSIMPISA